MAIASINAVADFRVGRVLIRAWQILAANFFFFFIVTIIVALPMAVLEIDLRSPGFGWSAELGRSSPTFGWSFAIAFILGSILHTIGQAVLLFGAFQSLRGDQVRPIEALRRALSRFFPLAGLGILSTLGVGVGTILLVVPGLILAVMWAVVVPVCVVERLGPTASMSRSFDLTRGHRWKLSGIMIPLLAVQEIGRRLVPFLLAPAGLVVMSLGVVLWAALWIAYWNCVLIMTYHDLRVAKEGVDTAQIAAIFD
jgi:hypothetical protein